MNTALALRLKSMDGIRGLLALVVAFGHSYATFVGKWLPAPIPNFSFAVDLFFILSGMVLFHSYRTKQFTYTQFFANRLFRLIPMLYFSIALVFLAFIVTRGELFPTWLEAGKHFNFALIGELTLTSELFVPPPGHINPPAWSISVEIFAVSVTVLCAIAIYRAVKTRLLTLVGCAVMIALFYWILGKTNISMARGFMGSIAGIIAYVLLVDLKINKFAVLSASTAAIIITIAFLVIERPIMELSLLSNKAGFIPSVIDEYLVVMLAAGVCYMVLISQPNLWDRVFEAPAISYLGKVSYSIYLLHMPAVFLLLPLRQDGAVVQNLFVAAAALGLTVIASGITFRFIETPFILLGRKILRAPLPVTAQPKIINSRQC
ncbi:hypothetical protein MXMO3_01833 [Maritalea myrionectae]|uniref:Acyltransferase 3 domain-containing protein n=1 Tax=Maritalea myrionectae TaxID=454601 RepID=A0A2R4ME90_9HYPH|nr:hypothetical protein MXMO3_01833 [Maritalea myrionectae]